MEGNPQKCTDFHCIQGFYDTVKVLLHECPELLHARADGVFFSNQGPCDYGELPLNFAVATNQLDMVQQLLKAKADPLAKDSDGHNAAHIAVLGGWTSMYDTLLDWWAAHAAVGPLADSLCISERINNDGLTCLALAAARGSPEVFMHVLQHKRQVSFSSSAPPVRFSQVGNVVQPSSLPSTHCRLMDLAQTTSVFPLPKLKALQSAVGGVGGWACAYHCRSSMLVLWGTDVLVYGGTLARWARTGHLF